LYVAKFRWNAAETFPFLNQEEESRLLREKIAALEERLAASDTRRHETEEEFAKNRRLVKLLEKYKCELNEAQSEVQDLKNRVVDFSGLQVRYVQRPLLYMDGIGYCVQCWRLFRAAGKSSGSQSQCYY